VGNDVDVLHVETKLVVGFSFIRDIDIDFTLSGKKCI